MKQLFTTALLLLATLNAQAVNPGNYVYDDGAGTIINVYTNVMSIETTSQVGGAFVPEVPFPTMCRIRMWGHVYSEDRQGFLFEAKIREVRNLTDLPNPEGCHQYVRSYNSTVDKFPSKFYYYKNSLKKIESKSSQ
jgi:hypothetical protein